MKYNIFSVPFYGLKSIRYAKLAFKLDSNNYMAYIQNGNVQVHMPGSIKRGIGYYLKAREIYEYMLVLEPDFIYVRDDLYPDLLKKMQL